VADLARALGFWHERLGLPVKLRADSVAELQSETILLVLEVGPPSPGDVSIAWEVGDLDAAREDLRSKGLECEDLPVPAGVDAAIHGRRCAFRDPDGHRLELACWT
jgi:catechol 2,3-dioxygenase-like lactoylglutathione lyase family enzyme